jgi:hypothetical protein
MRSIQTIFLAVFVLCGIETSQGHEGSSAVEKVGSSESEIRAYLENREIPLGAMTSKEARPFFKELGDRSGFRFILAEDVQGELKLGSEEDRTYRSFLDEALAENGYSWRRQPGTNWIWISAGLPIQRFSLSPGQRNHFEALVGIGRGGETDKKLRNTILGSASASTPQSDKASYRIEGSELVVTDTSSNIRRAKDYLDRHAEVETLAAPLSVLYEPPSGQKKDLRARRYTVTPAEDRAGSRPASSLRRTRQIDRTQRVLGSTLYSNQSLEEAAAQGRVMHPNREDGAISIVDTPQNLRKVEDYLSGARFGSGGPIRIYEPQHRPAGDLRNALNGIVLYTIP